MSIVRINSIGWGVGEKLTSAQQNALDINVTNAADKRAGESDTIGALWTFSGIGRLIATSVLGANADTSYQADGGNSVVRVTSAVTANRIYTLTATNAAVGDRLSFYCEASFNYAITIRDQALVTLFTLGNNADGTWAEFIYMGSSWRLYKYASLLKLRVQTFSANGNWLAPGNVDAVFLLGVGGGGGGGGGRYGYTTGYAAPAGSGGGGATAQMLYRPVTPGVSYAVSIGAGGAGGAGSIGHGTLNDGGLGSNGGDTTFGALATFFGAAGGVGASYTTSDFYSYNMASGTTLKGIRRVADYVPSTVWGGNPSRLRSPQRPGDGGWGGHETANWYGPEESGAAHGSNAGGTVGIQGSTGGGNAGGHGGGGGGASNYPGSTAGNGGNGGNGSGTDGFNGSPGTAGTKGGGGGGGGAGGNGPGILTGGGAGAGGAGGAGELTVIWFGS